DFGLIELTPSEPSCIRGYHRREAMLAMAGYDLFGELDEPDVIEEPETSSLSSTLCVHSLIREYFKNSVTQSPRAALKLRQERLFNHLVSRAPYWPDGLDSLKVLYQAVGHACHAGLFREAYELYELRICRGTAGPHAFYASDRLGAVSENLSILESIVKKSGGISE